MLSSTYEISTTSSSLESSSEKTPCLRILQEIYEVTKNQKNLILFCLFANCEPIYFEKTIQNKRLKEAMDKKIKTIKTNVNEK